MISYRSLYNAYISIYESVFLRPVEKLSAVEKKRLASGRLEADLASWEINSEYGKCFLSTGRSPPEAILHLNQVKTPARPGADLPRLPPARFALGQEGEEAVQRRLRQRFLRLFCSCCTESGAKQNQKKKVTSERGGVQEW